jgi:hypothetical protein
MLGLDRIVNINQMNCCSSYFYYKQVKKSNLPVYSMKACGWSRGISAPHHQMDVSFQLHSLAIPPLGKEPCHQLKRRLGGPQSRSGHFGEEGNVH